MGLTIRREESENGNAPPGEAARKRAAVELIRSHGTVLKATARRYSICSDDADDAYQRGIEILLSKAPATEERQLVPWARTVIKHEALAIRRIRERMLGNPVPAAGLEEEQDWVQLIPSTGAGPDEIAVSREKVARSREALGELKPAELRALTLLAEGYSYAEIGAMNNWTRTKVNRCLAEGRQRFRAVFRESEAGERCARFEPMISSCCDGELDRSRLVELEDHLAGCGHCRATLRAYRAAPRAAAALAPVVPASHPFWERVQEAVVSLQTKFTGIGAAEGSNSAVLAAGGTRGAGVAALAKVATLCAGTAGTAAVCVATGVLPAPALVPEKNDRNVAAERAVRDTAPPPVAVPVEDVRPGPSPSPETPVSSGRPANEKPDPGASKPAPPPPAPPPTPTESEFTPEAAGTPVPAAAPPPVAAAPGGGSSGGGSPGSIPVGGAGEFGP